MAPRNLKRSVLASFDEVAARWHQLDMDQRRELLSFNDEELVGRMVEALQNLQQQHDACTRAGLSTSEDADPFQSSVLLGDILTIFVQRHRGHEAGERHTFGMQIKDAFLEQDDIFQQLRYLLPDFLEPDSKRRPMARVAWKKLWKTLPQSFEALERQLAKTLEQAFWSMAQAMKRDESALKDLPHVPCDVSVDESWMNESPKSPGKSKKAQSKKSRGVDRQPQRFSRQPDPAQDVAEAERGVEPEAATVLEMSATALKDMQAFEADDWVLVPSKQKKASMGKTPEVSTDVDELSGLQTSEAKSEGTASTASCGSGHSDSAEEVSRSPSTASCVTGEGSLMERGGVGLMERDLFEDLFLEVPNVGIPGTEEIGSAYTEESMGEAAHTSNLQIAPPPGLSLPESNLKEELAWKAARFGAPPPGLFWPGLPLIGPQGYISAERAIEAPEVPQAPTSELFLKQSANFCGACGKACGHMHFRFCPWCGMVLVT